MNCVAQWVENRTHDLKGVGSSPAATNELCPYIGKTLYLNSISLPKGQNGKLLVRNNGPLVALCIHTSMAALILIGYSIAINSAMIIVYDLIEISGSTRLVPMFRLKIIIIFQFVSDNLINVATYRLHVFLLCLRYGHFNRVVIADIIRL